MFFLQPFNHSLAEAPTSRFRYVQIIFHWKKDCISAKQVVCSNFFVLQAISECGVDRLRKRMQVKQSNVVTNSVHRSIEKVLLHVLFLGRETRRQDGNLIIRSFYALIHVCYSSIFHFGAVSKLEIISF